MNSKWLPWDTKVLKHIHPSNVSYIWITEIMYIIPRLHLKLRPLLLLSQASSPQTPSSLKDETSLCFSFIRQMSPSQAMNNRSAPSVRRHPPGLVCSLLASVPCHGLAPAVCLPSTFFSVWHADALSVSLFLSFPNPFFPFTSLFAHLLTKSPKSNRQAGHVREGKNKRKIIYPTRGIWREVIYLPLFLELSDCLHSSWCAMFLPFSVFFCSSFHQTHSCSNLLKTWTI